LRSILLVIAGEGESERYLLIKERGRERVSKIKRHLEESMSWQDIANLTHATQVEKFNWCACEEQEQFPYEDCPRVGEGEK
jgi:hypothetical protein